MKIALINNVSNFATNLAPALRRRGHEVTVFGSSWSTLDRPDFSFNNTAKGLRRDIQTVTKRILLASYKRRNWDLVLNYEFPGTGWNGPEVIYWQGAPLFWGPKEYMKRDVPLRGYYCTPDIARFLSADSVLLPRAISIDRFKTARRTPRDPADKHPGTIRIAHLWRRTDLALSYFYRYWKKSDLLDDAIKLLQAEGYEIELTEGPVEREKMPEMLSRLDIFVDEFCGLSHSGTAVESLITGTPVIGSYREDLCECPAVFKGITNVDPNPGAIAAGIMETKDRWIPPIPEVEKFFTGETAADVLLKTYERFLQP